MPVLLLCIRAEMENVGSIQLHPGASFCFDVQEAGGAEVRKGIHVSAADEVELSGSKGTANFAMKFDKGSKKEATISIMDLKGVTKPYTADDGNNYVPIAAFECRGLDLIAYHPEGDWIVTSANSNTKWEDVDLSDEWTEYDEKSGESVGIYKIESMFKLHKM